MLYNSYDNDEQCLITLSIERPKGQEHIISSYTFQLELSYK